MQRKRLLQQMPVQRQGNVLAIRRPINATGRTGRPIVSVRCKRRPCLQHRRALEPDALLGPDRHVGGLSSALDQQHQGALAVQLGQ